MRQRRGQVQVKPQFKLMPEQTRVEKRALRIAPVPGVIESRRRSSEYFLNENMRRNMHHTPDCLSGAVHLLATKPGSRLTTADGNC